MKWDWKIPSAIAAMIGIATLVLVPVVQSDPAPWASTDHVAELTEESLQRFEQLEQNFEIQQKATQGYIQSFATSDCELWRMRVNDIGQFLSEHPGDFRAENDLEWAVANQEKWCGLMLP